MDQSFTIKHTHAAGAKTTVFRNKTVHHQSVCLQKVIYRCGIQLQHQFIGFIGVLHFFYLIRIAKDTFSI